MRRHERLSEHLSQGRAWLVLWAHLWPQWAVRSRGLLVERPRLVADPMTTPRDLTNAGGTFTRERAMSIRPCAACGRGIHIGHERINHHPLATSAVAYYYHSSCVVTPEGTP